MRWGRHRLAVRACLSLVLILCASGCLFVVPRQLQQPLKRVGAAGDGRGAGWHARDLCRRCRPTSGTGRGLVALAAHQVFYGVRRGRVLGVYKTWAECEAQISLFQKALYKKFDSEGAAQAFANGGSTMPNDRKVTFKDRKVTIVGEPMLNLANVDKWPTEYPTFLEDDEMSGLPQLTFDGKIHVVSCDTEHLIDWDVLESSKVFGFDIENTPRFAPGRNPTAVVQLATETDCWIFQMLYPAGVSLETKQKLQKMLQSPDVIKAGVGVSTDVWDLHLSHMPEMKSVEGFVDLKKLLKPYNLKKRSLQALAAILLRRYLVKPQDVTLGKWHQPTLDSEQIQYAAIDAYAGWKLHEVMRKAFKSSMTWAPPLRFDFLQGASTVGTITPEMAQRLELQGRRDRVWGDDQPSEAARRFIQQGSAWGVSTSDIFEQPLGQSSKDFRGLPAKLKVL